MQAAGQQLYATCGTLLCCWVKDSPRATSNSVVLAMNTYRIGLWPETMVAAAGLQARGHRIASMMGQGGPLWAVGHQISKPFQLAVLPFKTPRHKLQDLLGPR